MTEKVDTGDYRLDDVDVAERAAQDVRSKLLGIMQRDKETIVDVEIDINERGHHERR